MGAFSAFVVAAIVIVMLMFALSLGIAIAQERFAGTLREKVFFVKKWGGYILILVGLWLIMLSIWTTFFVSVFPV